MVKLHVQAPIPPQTLYTTYMHRTTSLMVDCGHGQQSLGYVLHDRSMCYNELYFRVHVQLSRRERPRVRLGILQVLISLIIRDDAIYRFGYVNSFGVNEPSPSHSVRVLTVTVVLSAPLLQVFQEYYQDVLLQGTSPSTMYVLSESFYTCSDIQCCHLLVPGQVLLKSAFLSNALALV